MIPRAASDSVTDFLSFPFSAVIGGTAVTTSIQGKEMIKEEKTGKHHLRNKCKVMMPLFA